MISTNDQQRLFTLITEYLKEDITCVAIGGTAMMFAGYKNTTKDIDLVFSSTEDRDAFIDAISELGYTKQSAKAVYDHSRLKRPDVPLMFTRGEERFDLFVHSVFGFPIPFDISHIMQRHDYIGHKHELIVHILPEEYLLLCKAITGREKDFEDIMTLAKFKKELDWNRIADIAVEYRKTLPWILLDLEESLLKLRKTVFIKDDVIKRLYHEEK